MEERIPEQKDAVVNKNMEECINYIDPAIEWDIIDELFVEPLNPIDNLLESIHDLILSGSDHTIETLRIRIAKLINYISSQLVSFQKQHAYQSEKSEQAQKNASTLSFNWNLSEFAQLISATLRYMYLIEHSSNDKVPRQVLLSIDDQRASEIIQLILFVHNNQEFSHTIPFTFKQALHSFYSFLLQIPKPFVVRRNSNSNNHNQTNEQIQQKSDQSNNFLEIIIQALIEELKGCAQNNELIIDLITEAYLRSANYATSLISKHLNDILAELIQYLEGSVRQIRMSIQNEEEQRPQNFKSKSKVITKIIRLLSFLCMRDPAIRSELILARNLPMRLYESIRREILERKHEKGVPINFSNIVAREELTQNMIMLISVLLAGCDNESKESLQKAKQLIGMLFSDCIQMIQRNEYAFVHSVLLPIIKAAASENVQCGYLVPVCFHVSQLQKQESNNSSEHLLEYMRQINDRIGDRVNQKGLHSKEYLKKKNRITSEMLNAREIEYLHEVLMDSGYTKEEGGMPKNCKSSWKKVSEISRRNPIVRAVDVSRVLKDRTNTLFVFKCLVDGETVKIVVSVTEKFREVVNPKKHALDTSSENLNIRATSNAGSVYVRFDEAKMLSMRSTCRNLSVMVVRNEIQEPTVVGAFKDDMKTYVLLEYDGLTFYFDDAPAIHVNFNNVDLSDFALPFWKAFTGSQVSAFQESAVLLEAEIWRYEEESVRTSEDIEEEKAAFLNIFEEKQLNALKEYSKEISKQRLEGVIFVPKTMKLKSLIEIIIDAKGNNNSISSATNATPKEQNRKISVINQGVELDLNEELKSIIGVNEGQNILDLHLSVDVLSELNADNVNDLLRREHSGCCDNQRVLFDSIREGMLRVFEYFERASSEKEQENLRVFYSNVSSVIRLESSTGGQHFVNICEFFAQTLKFQALNLASTTKITLRAMKSFHSSVQSMLTCVRECLLSNRLASKSIPSRVIMLNILSIAFESYSGIRRVSLRKGEGQKKKEERIVQSASAQLQSGLSNRGVGYGNGGSDMTWAQNYDGMVESEQPKSASNSAGSAEEALKKRKMLDEEELKTLILVEKLNEFSVISKYLDKIVLEKIVADILEALLGLFGGDTDRNVESGRLSDDAWIEGVKESNLHLMIINYLELMNVSSEASSDAKNKLAAVLQLLSKMCSTGFGLEDFLIWKSGEEDNDDNDEKDVKEVSHLEDLSKNKSVYSTLIDMKKRVETIVDSAASIEGILSFGSQLGKKDGEKKNEKCVTLVELIASIDSISKQLEHLGVVVVTAVQIDYDDEKEQDEKEGKSSSCSLEESNLLHTFMPSMLQSKCVTRSPFVVNGHHYSSKLSEFQGAVPTSVQVQRMVQEITGLQNSLEAQPASSIFICYDEANMNVMRCLVFGAEGTPYAHGGFVYDMLLPLNYPLSAPSVNLTTTGSGSWRFNPNLYHCGKVCLSLLGTWRGATSESWNPKISSILQLLLSLQAIVMSEYIYFNEPGYEGTAGTEEGEKSNLGYSNIVRLGNIRYAMIEQMRNPLPEFKEIILTTFYLKKHMILNECRSWLVKAPAPALYNGLVASHNPNPCDEIAKSGYPKLLEAAIKELEEEFEALKLKIDKTIIDAIVSPAAKKKKKISVLRDRKARVIVPLERFEEKEEGEEQNEQLNEKSDKLDESEKITIDESKITADIHKILEGFKKRDQVEEASYVEKNEIAKLQFSELSQGVKDRWSRYIGVMGLDSVKKQSNASVLIVGLDHVGVEIAKNIALSGVKLLALADQRKMSEVGVESLGQFFIFESALAISQQSKRNSPMLTVAESSLFRLRQLNEYVEYCVDQSIFEQIDTTTSFGSIAKYTTIVCVNQPRKLVEQVAKATRDLGIALISVDNKSVFSRIITDFGRNHTVIDSNGEPVQEYTVNSISVEGDHEIVVTLKPEVRHNLSIGSMFELREVVEDSNYSKENVNNSGTVNSFNGQVFKVSRIIQKNSLIVEVGSQKFAQYLRNGIIKEIKQPVQVTFEEYQKQLESPRFDANVCGENSHAVNLATHAAFNAIDEFTLRFGRTPRAWNIEDAIDFYGIAVRSSSELNKLLLNNQTGESLDEHNSQTINEVKRVIVSFALTMSGHLPAQGSVVGGIVAQEVIKSITQKWMPIQQVMVYNCEEILLHTIKVSDFIRRESSNGKKSDGNSDNITSQKGVEVENIQINPSLGGIVKNLGMLPIENKYDVLRVILGEKNLSNIAQASTFVVGAGAIGCELIKNLAMGGFAVHPDARITITDPDVIENSNLNRQFLFRTSHITLPKASVSAAAAMYMNGDLKDHVNARLEKVFEGSEHVFSDGFLEKQRVVLNALDNVQARQYVDKRCVSTKIAMIDSGTLGSKGHVQVVVPYVSESYESQADPAGDEGNEASIPQCTLKMFPENAIHCMEWAKDKFGRMFTQKPTIVSRVCTAVGSAVKANVDPVKQLEEFEEKVLEEALDCLEKSPKIFEDCLRSAMKKFYKSFNLNVKQLLHVYPLDHRGKDGSYFWTLPKRPPQALIFDEKNSTHVAFVVAFAKVRANVYRIPYSYEQSEVEEMLRGVVSKFVPPVFVTNEDKAKELIKQNKSNEKKNKQTNEENEDENEIMEVKPSSNTKRTKKSLIEEILRVLKVERMREQQESSESCEWKQVDVVPEEFEKDNDKNHHVDLLQAMTNCRAQNYALAGLEWMDVKIKAGRITPALVTTTAIVAGLQTLEAVKLVMQVLPQFQQPLQLLSRYKNSFINISLPSLVQSEPFEVQVTKLSNELQVSVWDRWEVKVLSQQQESQLQQSNNTIEKLFAYLETNYKLVPRDLIQGAKPVYIHALMTAAGKIKENAVLMKKDLLKLLVFKNKGDKFIDVIVTFAQDKDSNELVQGVPTIRLYFL